MAARRKSYKYKAPKRRKGAAKTHDAKARSMQSSWRKYTGQTLTISSAKAIIESPPNCLYCQKPIPWHELSLDHKQPRSRDGEDTPDNLCWVDRTCNQIKGALTVQEFQALLVFLKEWPVMQQDVLNRLRIAAAMFARKRRY